MKLGPFRLGMRTMKSALSVMICILIFHLAQRGNPMISALSAVFSLRQDFSTSLTFGKSRLVGNTIGGALAIVFFLISDALNHTFWVELVVLPLLLVVAISFSDGINNNAGIIAASATLLMISLTVPDNETVVYALQRVLDTFIGTSVAICLNLFVRPKEQEMKSEISEDLIELHKKEDELEELRAKIEAKKANGSSSISK
ncbi:MAG: aromatic acid exporter family protein [Lactobacillales bacterium]|jgi:uncharacterized membrane protein YgaE (UPF0421/DUF939 family)|nr:aromatic acid exporter family protein [Lactobacillales bacterium]